jgi:hypothetical protein
MRGQDGRRVLPMIMAWDCLYVPDCITSFGFRAGSRLGPSLNGFPFSAAPIRLLTEVLRRSQ